MGYRRKINSCNKSCNIIKLSKLQKSDIKSEFGCCENRLVHQPQKLSFDSTRLCSQSPSSGIVLSSFRTQIVLYGMNALNICADQPPVTTHAARKWLMGEAMPTQDRIQLLAEWLNVSASWLRFGEDGIDGNKKTKDMTAQEWRLVEGFRLLTDKQQAAVLTMVLSIPSSRPGKSNGR